MDRFLRLLSIWDYLPAFRAVAESLYLPEAAQRLATSPSAVSRSIGLLQQRLGVRLFMKRGRRLELLPAGEQLLSTVRVTMRNIETTSSGLAGEAPSGSLRIGASPELVAILVPALVRLTNRWRSVVPAVSVQTRFDPAAELLTGRMDGLLTSEPFVHPEIELYELGRLRVGLFAGATRRRRGAKASAPSKTEMFVAFAPDGVERWPLGGARTPTMLLPQLDLVIEACGRHGASAVLPVELARRAGLSALRLPQRASAEPVFWLVRRSIGGVHLVDRLTPLLRRPRVR